MSLSGVLVDRGRVLTYTAVVVELSTDPAAVGPIAASSLLSGGTGWVAGDEATLAGAALTATLVVDEVGIAGAITAYHLSDPGSDFSPGLAVAVPISPADPDATATISVEAVDDALLNTVETVKVEGETQMTWAEGEWFACRLDSPAAAESRDAAAGRDRVAQKPALIYELEDEAGGVVELHAADRVQVDSEELGDHIFEIEGEPTLDRKKTDLICGEASLSRIVDQARAEAAV